MEAFVDESHRAAWSEASHCVIPLSVSLIEYRIMRSPISEVEALEAFAGLTDSTGAAFLDSLTLVLPIVNVCRGYEGKGIRWKVSEKSCEMRCKKKAGYQTGYDNVAGEKRRTAVAAFLTTGGWLGAEGPFACSTFFSFFASGARRKRCTQLGFA